MLLYDQIKADNIHSIKEAISYLVDQIYSNELFKSADKTMLSEHAAYLVHHQFKSALEHIENQEQLESSHKLGS